MTSRLHKLYAIVARHNSEKRAYINIAMLPIPIEVAVRNKNLKATYWVIHLMEAVRRLDE